MTSFVRQIIISQLIFEGILILLLSYFPITSKYEIVILASSVFLLNIFVCIYLGNNFLSATNSVKTDIIKFVENNEQKLSVTFDYQEFADLNLALEILDNYYQDQISEISEKANEQGAVIASMNEGVLAVDLNENIIKMNRVACEIILNNSSFLANRKKLIEVIRNHDLLEFVRLTIKEQVQSEKEITIYDERKKILKFSGLPLRNLHNEVIGALIVFNDITKLREVEGVRRDFVANVSHELRTPITSIKGFVETILNGAIDSPEDLSRFLSIIQRQANRLEIIIEELLNLAKIEQSVEKKQIEFNAVNLSEILELVFFTIEKRLKEKNLVCEFNCPENFTLKANRPLLEQALHNLLSNAINYSDYGKKIEVSVFKDQNANVIKIKDNGIGISTEHLPRIFERFYRVDKSRSRKDGGSGLGLSIVKHIVLAHSGELSVASELGKGTEFNIKLP